MYVNKPYPHPHVIFANRERITVPATKQDCPTGPFRLLATKINRIGAAADGTTRVVVKRAVKNKHTYRASLAVTRMIPARSRPMTAQAAGVTP